METKNPLAENSGGKGVQFVDNTFLIFGFQPQELKASYIPFKESYEENDVKIL